MPSNQFLSFSTAGSRKTKWDILTNRLDTEQHPLASPMVMAETYSWDSICCVLEALGFVESMSPIVLMLTYDWAHWDLLL